jgi:hypothetical protein
MRVWEQAREDSVWGADLGRWEAQGDRAYPFKDKRTWFKNYTYTIFPIK